ncbi:hypothetical protein RFI_31320, partial [Reticulomyxa filosa]
NKLYNDQEKMKQNAKGAVNQMLSTKTYNLNKSSMVYDINPDYLENENFFQEKKKGILNQIGIHLLKMTPKIVLRKVVKWILKINDDFENSFSCGMKNNNSDSRNTNKRTIKKRKRIKIFYLT